MEFALENCWGGNLEALQAYCARTNMTVERIRELNALQWACENGHLDIARWLQQTFQLTVTDARAGRYYSYALRGACANGHLEVARWLQQTFQLNVTDVRAGEYCAFRGACEHGHLEVARWLQQTFQLTAGDVQAGDNYALRWACEFGHLEVARWLQQTFQLDPYQAACNLHWERTDRDRLEVIRWLQRTWGCPLELQEIITSKAPVNAPWITYVHGLNTICWSPRTHADFPLISRRHALLLLLIYQRLVGELNKPGALPYLPPELWLHLLSYLPAYLPAPSV